MPPLSEIQLKITIDNTGAVASVINLGKNVDNAENKVNQLSESMHMAFIKGGLAFDGLKTMFHAMTGMFGGVLGEYEEQEKANAKVEAVIRATGAAGYTAEEMNKLSETLSQNSQFTDEAILDSQGLLLTFKAIGTDIDTDVLGDEIYNNKGCFVEKRDFIKNPPTRKFKSIVANPPYIRHHRIDEETKLILKKLSATITGFTIDGRAGYHIYFFIQALNLLEKGGRLAFIMPADTCEGTFATRLWKWISEKYCIEAVITFEEKATPFPNVDTNAIIFLIKNSKPTENIYWVKSKEAYSNDLLEFISSKFKTHKFKSLEIIERELTEAINTGLTRPQQNHNGFKFHLYDFAKVMRGIATGSNEFFFLTAKQVKELGIPKEFIKRAVGRTKDAIGNILTDKDILKLEDKDRPTYLFAINGHDKFPKSILSYLKVGTEMGLPDRALIKQRKPWYKMEKREIPPLLFAYLGRRSTRFILNEARVLPLTSFLCVYPIHNDKKYITNLWQALNHPDTLENLKLVGKSYGSGALKVEPGNLNKLPIPEHIVEQFELKRQYITLTGQLDIFREPKKKYITKRHLTKK